MSIKFKVLIKVAAYFLVVLIIGVLFTFSVQSQKHVKTLKNHVVQQSVVIDSLLNRRMTVFDVQLNVTDKSKNNIYGRYNKGTIEMPSVKSYKLEIDSLTMIK